MPKREEAIIRLWTRPVSERVLQVKEWVRAIGRDGKEYKQKTAAIAGNKGKESSSLMH
jgi:hypothetical protein